MRDLFIVSGQSKMKSQSQPKRSSQNPQKDRPKTGLKSEKKFAGVDHRSTGVNPYEEKLEH